MTTRSVRTPPEIDRRITVAKIIYDVPEAEIFRRAVAIGLDRLLDPEEIRQNKDNCSSHLSDLVELLSQIDSTE